MTCVNPSPADPCPCGRHNARRQPLPFSACCGPLLADRTAHPAPSAEALMRSRYTAHTLGKYDYLNETVHPSIRDEADHEEMKRWSEAVEWLGLDISSVTRGEASDETGEVSFEARYAVNGMPQALKEDAFFRREEGRWYYVDGNVYGQDPYRREAPKVGRNEPCPCGSGKKYKKCCGK